MFESFKTWRQSVIMA